MSVLEQKIIELIAIGASYAVNCKPCMEYHKKAAEAAGVTPEEMLAAVAVGEKVKGGAAVKAKAFARDIFGEGSGEPCCAPGSGSCSS
jgi:AhpD family alkylhydroperoxidase